MSTYTTWKVNENLAAMANIHLFGKQGYRVLIGHIVEMAEMLRERKGKLANQLNLYTEWQPL
jgi:hypothetical protein